MFFLTCVLSSSLFRHVPPWQTFRLYTYAQGLGHKVHEIDATPSAMLGKCFWEWLDLMYREHEPAVLSLPRLSPSEIEAMAKIPEAGMDPIGVCLCQLPASAGLPGVIADVTMLPEQNSHPVDGLAAEVRTRAWVQRALTPGGLSLCPYTASDKLAGVRLESVGVKSAPILHSVSLAVTATGVLSDVWKHIEKMVEQGEDATSSIVMSAPMWDDRYVVV